MKHNKESLLLEEKLQNFILFFLKHMEFLWTESEVTLAL